MKVLITGAGGIVGNSLIDKIEGNESIEIYALTGHAERIAQKKVTVVCDGELDRLLKNSDIDVMVHLAYPRNVDGEGWAKGISYSYNLLNKALCGNIKKIIHVSSQSLYGLDRKREAKEEDNVILNSPYTTGKYCMELMTNMMFKKGCYTNVRLATIISPQTNERVINKLIDDVLNKRDLNIRGGDQRLSFLDVRDAADALEKLITKNELIWSEIYNIGTSENYSLLEIAKMIVETGEKFGFYNSEIKVKEENVVLNNTIDCKKFREEFNWESKYTLTASIQNIFEHKLGLEIE